MKLDRYGIRFRVWLAFFLLALVIVLFIGVLQIGLIRPYYRNAKIRTVQTVTDNIQADLIDNGTVTGINHALQEAVDNNACVFIYNDQGSLIYRADSLGTGCIFNEESILPEELATAEDRIAVLQDGTDYSNNIVNTVTGQEMILYGRKISDVLGNYYLFINSPLEPVDSVVTFFSNQYLAYMLLALAGASLLAFYISARLTKPIREMKQQAQKLANADYSASFDGGEFTETKELASTLNGANEMIKRTDELRRDLMANVSHDIRTPLTNIKAYAEMIRDVSGKDPEKREKHLNVILRETDYMNSLVNDMSELSQMQSGTYQLHLANMDLSMKIRQILETDQPLIENGKLKIVTEIPETLTMYADETKIGQVISNYLSNAIKHTPAGKTITVRAFILKDEETVHFEVQDEGEGIPKEELPLIWNRYQKSSRSFSRSLTSTGLGLSIVKAIADAHHGTCGASSTLGKGSTFWFELKETHEA
ncbi:MAG: HAMP domain-containing histidine kinase [Solobacterium sp.]|nr:HAMP domain-containing histidine kinase [Solobacterium sp.]MCH4205655.1 HAMP domain-containing histidine kinase [Solobacterium sp.]MCH4227152.1 HAMP domain-containing histidine kinase [Solobacterium sp.]MCH4282485.1 HAMP domain-containing histidine kinase [Solobacterium sp.]